MRCSVRFLVLLVAALVLAAPGVPARAETGAAAGSSPAFAGELYKVLAKKGGNLFFSPFSIDVALAMTSTGAAGETLAQMQKVLGLSGDADAVAKQYGQLLKSINAPKEGYDIAVANALWGQKGFNFLPAFVKRLETTFGAGMTEVDFKTAAEAARKTINTWVEEKTKNRISNLIPEGILTPLTRLVLTNAVWFKGTWTKAFPKEETTESPFYRGGPGQDPVQVQMMSQSGAFRYGSAENCAVLELPYGKAATMIVILPEGKGADLAALEAAMTPATLETWLALPTPQKKVEVYLPRFKMTSACSLKPVLAELGMKDAFSDNAADFSGMNGKKDLVIAAVLHKAFVEVNEAGTEAAAATAVVMRTKGMSMDERPTPVFRADHPFLFMIRDESTRALLFMGRVADPTATGE